MPKLFDQALLLGFVEINHDVAAQNNVVAARQKLGLQVMKIEGDELFQLRLDFVLIASFFEIAEPAGVIDGFHLLLCVKTLLTDAKASIADVRSNDFHFPGRRNEGLRRGHIEWKRIPQVVISECIANQNGNGVRLLAGRATGAPDTESVVAAFLLAAENVLKNGFLEEIELRAISKKTGLVDSQIFEQESELSATFPAGEQAIIGVERLELAGLQTALQAIFQEMRAALVEKHATFLIDQRLEELKLCFGELDLGSNRSHCVLVRRTRNSAQPGASRTNYYLAVATGSAASSSRLYSGRCKSLEMSSRIMRRPFNLPTPVT